MQDISSEAMACALAVMLILLPPTGTKQSLTRRLISALACAVVVALALSSIFFHRVILAPITSGQKTIFGYAAIVILLAAIVIYFRLAWLARAHRAEKTANGG